MNFLIGRTDNLGDVILTFPLAAKLKEFYPDAKITMLARNYTKDIVERCQDIDSFLSDEALFEQSKAARISHIQKLNFDVFIPANNYGPHTILARQAGIPIRIGNIYHNYYLFNANRLMWRTKRKSPTLHQAQLALYFLKGLGLPHQVPREKLLDLIRMKPVVPSDKVRAMLDPKRFNLVLHPGSNGHTVEWPKEHFAMLMRLLPDSVKVFVTGSKKEEEKYGDLVNNHPHAVAVFGDLSLGELADFLSLVDGVVIGSTGPLHLAAALGTHVIGLFPPHIGSNVRRWGAIGKNVINIEAPERERFRRRKRSGCMFKITPEHILNVMQKEWSIG